MSKESEEGEAPRGKKRSAKEEERWAAYERQMEEVAHAQRCGGATRAGGDGDPRKDEVGTELEIRSPSSESETTMERQPEPRRAVQQAQEEAEEATLPAPFSSDSREEEEAALGAAPYRMPRGAAKEAMPHPPLPPDWEECLGPDGQAFYINHRSQVTSWDRPRADPPSYAQAQAMSRASSPAVPASPPHVPVPLP